MKKEYFNLVKYIRAFKLLNSNPDVSLELFEKYINDYPVDYSAYPHYIGLLVGFGRIEEACELYDDVVALANGNNKFKRSGKYRLFEHNMILAKIKILSYLGKYDELYYYYKDNYDNVMESEIRQLAFLSFYCRKQMGWEIVNLEMGISNYMYDQIENYSEELLFEHLKKRLPDYIDDSEEPVDSIFAIDFPIEEVIQEVKKYIPSDKKFFGAFMGDTYVFKYDFCGRNYGHITDYFKVECFHNSGDIITMYPASKCEDRDYVDLNYLKEKHEPKIMRKSMVERFNNRYNR